MREALSEAEKSGEDVPVGAVVVYKDRVIARAHNERESGGGPFAHAELLAMQRAAEIALSFSALQISSTCAQSSSERL